MSDYWRTCTLARYNENEGSPPTTLKSAGRLELRKIQKVSIDQTSGALLLHAPARSNDTRSDESTWLLRT